MNIKKIIKSLGKNILVLLFSSITGGVIGALYGYYVWLPSKINSFKTPGEVMVGTLPSVILSFLIFGILGAILGSITGILIYWLILLIKKVK